MSLIYDNECELPYINLTPDVLTAEDSGEFMSFNTRAISNVGSLHSKTH